MINNGLFSKLFLDEVRGDVSLGDSAEGRMATLAHRWGQRDDTSTATLWDSFCKQALSGLEFIPGNQPDANGIYPLHEDYTFSSSRSLALVLGSDADLDETSAGRFWPVKLVKALRERQLTWGILTNGRQWRLYSTKTGKPYEDYVELPLGDALEADERSEYALFERFFHADAFEPEEDGAAGEERTESVRLYTCRLDRDAQASEKVLEDKVKKPLLDQVDEALQFICNGFIADRDTPEADCTEGERRQIFESAVKLLYRCMFLFYAESRKLLPSEADKRAEYEAEFSIHQLCCEARKFVWHERDDNRGYDLWQHLKGLVRAVNEGDAQYGIMGYNGGLFDDDEQTFLGRHRLRNDFFARALYLISHVQPPVGQGTEAEYEIPFRDLQVRHLGELYESILEFNVLLADVPRIRRRTRKGVAILPASSTRFDSDTDTRIEAGQVYFAQTALERKQSGSYYTPESLVGFLVDKGVVRPLRERFERDVRARLDEYIEQARNGFDEATRRGAAREAESLVLHFAEERVLNFKVCDPAMGSGHFLVSAANRLTDLIVEWLDRIPTVSGAAVSAADSQPNSWRRRVTRHCLYGVDFNPLAVDLAKLSLWLNCFATEHKLTFLDHRLKHGNSLMGVRDIAALQIIPERRKRNPKKKSEWRIGTLFSRKVLTDAAGCLQQIDRVREDDTEEQRNLYKSAMDKLRGTPARIADAYTSYLALPDVQPDAYRVIIDSLATGQAGELFDNETHDETHRHMGELARRHRYFHWPLEFPDVFGGREHPGFDATVGNPPWDIVKPNSQEFFSNFDPAFRSYGKQEAERKAEELMNRHPVVREKWDAHSELIREQSVYVRQPAAYSSLGSGDINTFKLFLEQFFRILKQDGSLGIVVPSGLYTDKGCQPLRELFFDTSRIDCLYCFENRWPTVFTAVDGRFKFVVFSARKGGETESFKCAFMEHDPERLPAIDAEALRMKAEDVQRFSPGTLSIMEFKNQRDIDIAAKIYDGHPLLGEQLPDTWNVKFTREFDMTNDSHLFHTREQLEDMGAREVAGHAWAIPAKDGPTWQELRAASLSELRSYDENDLARLYLPLYEGKQIWQFDSEYDKIRYWVRWHSAIGFKRSCRIDATKYRVGYRDIAASTNERTLVSAVIPPAVHGNKIPTARAPVGESDWSGVGEKDCLLLGSLLNSFLLDFLIRNKITTTLNFFYVYSLPVLRTGLADTVEGDLLLNALRLTCERPLFRDLWSEVFPYTESAARGRRYEAYGPQDEQQIRQRLAESAQELTAEWGTHCGVHDRTPNRRDTGDRAQLRAEIDAYVAHLYGLSREEFAYILDTFPVLRRNEEKAFGEFMSKRKCLEEYERLGPVITAQS